MKSRTPLIAILMMASALPAQQLIRLQDGSRVEARLRSGSRAALLSVFGLRFVDKETVVGVVPSAQVDGIRESYEAQTKRANPDDNRGRAALARWCLDQGFYTGAKEQLEAVFRRDPDCRPAQELVARIAEEWLLDADEVGPKPRDRRRHIRNLFSRHAARDLTTAMICAHKLREVSAEDTLRSALKGLKHKEASVRWLSARELARHRRHPERINPLYRRCLLDPAPAVRREAVRSLKVLKDPVFVRLFAKNLFNKQQRLRMTAAEALGELGSQEAVLPLVDAMRLAGSGGASGGRSHIAVTRQRAYVKDFDVEVAQAAVIADPVIDIVTEGVILDVRVVSVSVERAAYAGALRRITGETFGGDAKAWRDWLKGRQK